MTNNLLDLSEFDNLSNSGSGPILELTPNLANEDTLNSNLNPTAIPFTPMANSFVSATNANTNPFQDVFNNKQDNQVTGESLHFYPNHLTTKFIYVSSINNRYSNNNIQFLLTIKYYPLLNNFTHW